MMNKIFFKDFIKLKRGYDLPSTVRVEGIYPVIASTSINGYHNAYKVKPPVVVTGRSGSLGSVQYINKEAYPLNTTLYVTDFKGNHPKYVYYKLKTLSLERFNSGAGVPSLNRNDLDFIKISIHSYPTQKKIARILSNYDDLIKNNQKRIAILEQMAQNLYKEWFVRFRFPGWEEVEFVDGIPKGWEKKRFKDFIQLKRGYDLPNDKIVEGQYPIVASTNIKGFHDKFKVNPPCVATGRSGSLGIVQYINQKCWVLNTSLYVKDFKDNSPRFVYYLLVNFHLERFNSGAGVPTLNRNHLDPFKLIIPSKKMQMNFDKIIIPIFKGIDNFKKKNQILKQSRNRLLPRLLSGKLKV